jgi:hypothetical protein
MKYFPTICVDNFFENPDKVREFALAQNYETSSNTYAGVRSDELAVLNRDLFDAFCHKVLTLFNTEDEVIGLRLSARFQKIPRISTTPELNTGWVHDDGENIFAGLVYLNPNPNPESGTSLYMLKEGEEEYNKENTLVKRDLYGGTLTDEQVAVDAITRHNNKFIETARFNNVYNRLVCYDASVYHKANSYDNDEDRLTLVFFLQEYEAKSIPLIRSREYPI